MPVSAFRMQLKAGAQAAYKARHDAIWPELTALLSASGISEYRIFLDEATLYLFAVMTLSEDHQTADLPNHPLMRRWWDYMADLMEVLPDNRPAEWPLTQVFYHA